MQSELEILKEELEKEVWFLIDNSIDEKRKLFWMNNFKIYPELNSIYESCKNITDQYNDEEFDISDEKFNEIISKVSAVKRKDNRLILMLKNILSLNDNDNQVKVLIGGTLAAIALIFVLLSPSKIDNTQSDDSLLTWEGKTLKSLYNQIDNNISGGKNEKAKQYIMEQIKNDEWKSSVFTIASKIEELEEELNSNSL
ncbi:MAG: hypothetical protein CMF23_05590 [Ignavibacteriae bacterium]|nr:hypothetical protein [Ignavibacteriota bacterium]